MENWNTKQRVCFYAAAALFLTALLCGIQASTGGGAVYRGVATALLAFAIITAAGVWTMGLDKPR